MLPVFLGHLRNLFLVVFVLTQILVKEIVGKIPIRLLYQGTQRNREECNEYDEDLALAVRQEEEDAKKWQQEANLYYDSEDDVDSDG